MSFITASIKPTTVTMLVGLPGSGKSYYVKYIAPYDKDKFIISTDNIREELYGDASIQENPNKVFNIAFQRIKDAIREKKNVFFDATNIRRKYRIHFCNEMKKVGAEIRAIIIATPYEQCIKNNRKRMRTIPEEAIKKMLVNFEVPILQEGFDKIEIFHNGKRWEPYSDQIPLPADLWEDCFILHDCEPWHRGFISGHIEAVVQCCRERNVSPALGWWHDIGKPYVKLYNEKKKRCTYYNHNNVSAYLYLTRHPDSNIETAFLIEQHMRPHFYKDKEKCREELSKEPWYQYNNALLNKLLAFEECDTAGSLAVEGMELI